MELFSAALEEIAYEGLEGVTISGLWDCFNKRHPPLKCLIDKWTKPYLWKQLAQSEFIQFYVIDFNGPKAPELKIEKSERRTKLPNQFWIYNDIDGSTGYSTSYYYRSNVTAEILGEGTVMSLDDAEKKYGDSLVLVAAQNYRRRLLFGSQNSPIIEEIVPLRYILLEIIGKTRWTGFMQADFQKIYGMDPRTSFHHIKLLLKLHLVTKQNVVMSYPVRDVPVPIPPSASKMLHLSVFSNVYTNNSQRHATRICSILQQAPDQTMDREELKQICQDIPQFKKVRQWLFNNGYIRYIVDGVIWSVENTDISQVTRLRACRPCYVTLVKMFNFVDTDDDKDDDFLDYIENCDDIEPQLIYEDTMHYQAYRVIRACRGKGITMKKLAEVMCIPYTMARSIIRYFDTKKLGRIVTIDHMKLKLQKIVAIQFLHQSETVKNIQSHKEKYKQHNALLTDEKPKPKAFKSGLNSSLTDINNELADEMGFTRVCNKNQLSLRHLARKNFILDSLKEQLVFEGTNLFYKNLVVHEEVQRHTQGICCRKTFRKILQLMETDGQLKKFLITIDNICTPPLMVPFYCASHITEESPELTTMIEASKERYKSLEKRKEFRKAVRSKNFTTIEPTQCSKVNEEEANLLTDTDDEEFEKKSQSIVSYKNLQSKFYTYGRFQKLHVLHIYLWVLLHGTETDMEQLVTASAGSVEYSDLIQSRHMWLPKVRGLPKYIQGEGWFKIGDIISLMPLEVMCRVIGIRCWSDTVIKYLEDSEKRLLRMTDLPPRLKYKLLLSPANKQHLDITVDLLVLLTQMGLIAVSKAHYPNMRSEIMLYLRKEAQITDTRCSEKTYCQTIIPEGLDAFPVNCYRFKTLMDVEKYWTDLQFVCLNTPLGLNRLERSQLPKSEHETHKALGLAGIGKPRAKVSNKILRSFTVLRDFQQYYEDKDFLKMETVVFGNGLGAAGLDSIFFGHLAKNWQFGRKERKYKKNQSVKISEKLDAKSGEADAIQDADVGSEICSDKKVAAIGKKILVSNLMVQQRKGGKGLKRKLTNTSVVVTKKMKIERKKQFDKMIAKRFENVREKVRLSELKRKAMRKGKKDLHALNHDEADREALRKMKGMRVSFTEREDSYIMLAEIVKAMMKLYEKGRALEREHPKIFWRVIRDLIHKDVPESLDKTWNAIERRARYIKKYPHSLIVYNTCVAELEQNKEFMSSLECTRENWQERLLEVFAATRESYGRHFNEQVELENFPSTVQQLNEQYVMEFAHKEIEEKKIENKSENDIRVSILEDLIHNSLTAQKLTTYIPSVAFKVFDDYGTHELNKAFHFYKQNRLISRCRVDLPRRRSIPVSTMTYNLSTLYYRLFEPAMPLRIYQVARGLFIQLRDGKPHSNISKEQDILKSKAVAAAGSCNIDFSKLAGGHVAYLISVLVNKKATVQYFLQDEMTKSDEGHMEKLREGNMNFQSLAFEQRLKRGETLTSLAVSTQSGTGEVGHQRDDQSSDTQNDNTMDNTDVIEGERIVTGNRGVTKGECSDTDNRIVTEGKCSDTDNKSVPYSDTNIKDVEHSNTHNESFECSDTRSESIERSDTRNEHIGHSDSHNEHIGHCDSHNEGIGHSDSRKENDLRTENVLCHKNKVDKAVTLTTLATCMQVSSQKSLNKDLISPLVDVPTSGKRKRTQHNDAKVATKFSKINSNKKDFHKVVRHKAKKKYGNIFSSLHTYSFKCTYRKSHTTNVTRRSARSFVVNRKDFCYGEKGYAQVKTVGGKFDFLKMGKIHASRTALTMHRSIDDKQLMPTNAMNTHDALVINPMYVDYHMKSSPFRTVFTKPKYHVSDREMWKRCRQQEEDVGNREGLSIGEYSVILRDDFHLAEQHINAHVTIINRVNDARVVGVKKQDCMVIFSDICQDVLNQWQSHLQTLLNFRMLYHVGHYDERLVGAMYYIAWCYRAPQVISNFESKENEKSQSKKDASEKNVPDSKKTEVTTQKKNSERDTVSDIPCVAQMLTDVNIMSSDVREVSSSQVAEDGSAKAASCSSAQTAADESHDVACNKQTVAGSITQAVAGSSTQEKEKSVDDNTDTDGAKSGGGNSTLSFKWTRVRPWLKMDGSLNGVLLKRFQEIVLTYIMLNPGVMESQILKNFHFILKPCAVRSLLHFLEINGTIKKHFQQKKKATLFSTLEQAFGTSNDEIYYLPTKCALLNMMDMNR